MVATIVATHQAQATNNTTSYSADFTLNGGGSNRAVLLCVHQSGGNNYRDVSTATFGGNTATILANIGVDGGKAAAFNAVYVNESNHPGAGVQTFTVNYPAQVRSVVLTVIELQDVVQATPFGAVQFATDDDVNIDAISLTFDISGGSGELALIAAVATDGALASGDILFSEASTTAISEGYVTDVGDTPQQYFLGRDDSIANSPQTYTLDAGSSSSTNVDSWVFVGFAVNGAATGGGVLSGDPLLTTNSLNSGSQTDANVVGGASLATGSALNVGVVTQRHVVSALPIDTANVLNTAGSTDTNTAVGQAIESANALNTGSVTQYNSLIGSGITTANALNTGAQAGSATLEGDPITTANVLNTASSTDTNTAVGQAITTANALNTGSASATGVLQGQALQTINLLNVGVVTERASVVGDPLITVSSLTIGNVTFRGAVGGSAIATASALNASAATDINAPGGAALNTVSTLNVGRIPQDSDESVKRLVSSNSARRSQAFGARRIQHR